jgi:hypothetical protein
VLPGGIAHLTNFGDTLLIELPPNWAGAYDYSFVRDIETGEVVGEPNLLEPYGRSVEALHPDVNGPAMIGIEVGKLHAGHTYTLTWPISLFDSATSDLQASVEYWHLDRFKTEMVIGCQGTVVAPFVDESLPSSESLGTS